MEDVRMTVAVAVVLRIFLEDAARPRYGYELMQLTGYPSGKLYPVLARLERTGWLIKEQENIDPAAAGRPARRWYRLTGDGHRAAADALAQLSEKVLPPPQSPPGLTEARK